MTDATNRFGGSAVVTTIAAALIGLPIAASGADAAGMLNIPDAQLEPVAWTALEGWAAEDHAAAFSTFLTSCDAILRGARYRNKARRIDARPMRAALEGVCRRAVRLKQPDAVAAKAFFEANFRPVQIAELGREAGFITGYYEPVVEGSRFPSYEYDIPLYARPSNLIPLGRVRSGEFPNKGPVGRRVGRKKVVPYYERAEIEEGALAGRGLEICWVKDPIDAFFLHIQGSARVKLDTGKTLRLNYAAHNGHPYTPVGRVLIDRGEVPEHEMSMDRIRQWMQSNPDKARELRHRNKSYIFMRETGLGEDAEPIGAQGVQLTAGRSIAVDRALHVYGTPFFISAPLPIESEAPRTPFNRLMVAQDTGSAIVGPARADIYYGAGTEAGMIAGRFRHPGKFAMFVPMELDPMAVGAKMPVPRPRPPLPEAIVTAATTADLRTAKSVPLPKPKPPARSIVR
jgi:membrane-bound lytic murein transglycosylase A